jgi:hypothetical protein
MCLETFTAVTSKRFAATIPSVLQKPPRVMSRVPFKKYKQTAW